MKLYYAILVAFIAFDLAFVGYILTELFHHEPPIPIAAERIFR